MDMYYMDNTTGASSPSNDTVPVTLSPVLKTFYDIFIPSILALTMLSMGCGIIFTDLKTYLKKPVGPIIGLTSQFIIMPALAFGYMHALNLSSHHAIGIVIVASCPGGSVSNIFTYWSRGDLPLSICMTLISTVLALGFMPLNMFIYLRSWTDQEAVIPFLQIISIIALTWIPVFIGIIIGWKSKRVATYIVRIGSVASMTLIVGAGIVQNQLSPKFYVLEPIVWFAGLSLPLIGFTVGFIFSSIACLEIYQRRTIALETGIQNTGIALTAITLSFPLKEANALTQTPMLFLLAQMTLGFIVTLVHVVYFRIKDRCCSDKTKGEPIPEDEEDEKSEEKLFTVEIETSLDDAMNKS